MYRGDIEVLGEPWYLPLRVEVSSVLKSGALIILFFFSLLAHANSDCSALLNSPNWRRVLYSSHSSGEVAEVFGAPKTAQIYVTRENEIFRQYLSESGVLDRILEERALRSGVLPYVVSEPGLKKEYFIDLTGAFITKSDFYPHQVGLGRNPQMDYIDFILAPETSVIRLEEGIFLLPGKPIFQKWIQDAFFEWKKSGSKEYPAEHTSIFRRIQASSGKPELVVPIQIQAYRQNGKVKSLNAEGPFSE